VVEAFLNEQLENKKAPAPTGAGGVFTTWN